MTREDAAVNILHRCGLSVSAALDEPNFREKKKTVIKALNLIVEGKRDEARKIVAPVGEKVWAEVEAYSEERQ